MRMALVVLIGLLLKLIQQREHFLPQSDHGGVALLVLVRGLV
jgi:hypothetical protein